MVNRFYRSKRLQTLLLSMVALIGAVLFVWVLGPAQYRIDGFTVHVAVRPALSGRTVIQFPPLGTLTARTHRAPLECRVTLLQVEERMVTDTLKNPDLSTLWDRLEQETNRALEAFAMRQFLLGILGAVILSWLTFRPPLRRLYQPALAGLLLITAWLAPAYFTYRADAFKHPSYSGIIEAAPRVLAFSNDLVSGFHEFKAKAPTIAANLQALFNQADSLNASANHEEEIKLLLISDIHNNPVGAALARQLAQRFDVDAVLDAGDLTDLGSPLELNLIEDIKKMEVPYVLAPGNHDSPEVINSLSLHPKIRILDGRVVNVAGLAVLGSPDPSAYRPTPTADSPAREEAELQVQADALAEVLDRSERPVHVLMVHDPRLARRFVGRVPLLVCGHTHRVTVEGDRSSLLLNPGTTGAAGIRGLQSVQEIPYSAVVVHLDPVTKEPTAVNVITYRPREGSFRVEHRTIMDPATQRERLTLAP
ncbi:MAG: metallophosphoesterase family protein [Bacillota bacterium]